MSNEAKKPIILLAFANDRDDRERYLRNLAEEARRLREALEPACARSSCARTPPCGTSSTSSRCFCQLKREPFDGRKGNHFGQSACTLTTEKGTI